jgi:hypothetical protein
MDVAGSPSTSRDTNTSSHVSRSEVASGHQKTELDAGWPAEWLFSSGTPDPKLAPGALWGGFKGMVSG